MKEMTATSLRKELFRALAASARSVPTRIRYKKGDSVLLSYAHYLRLIGKPAKMGSSRTMGPLMEGKILKPLDQEADAELMDYMGLA